MTRPRSIDHGSFTQWLPCRNGSGEFFRTGGLPAGRWPGLRLDLARKQAIRRGKMAQNQVEMDPKLNVLGEPLKPCSTKPMTGFFRDGCCNTGPADVGRHTVCCQVTDEFLALSKYLGNDLSTPRPEFGFAGLKDGDRWCLCVDRWAQAYDEGAAPHVLLQSTHQNALETVPLAVLMKFALDMV